MIDELLAEVRESDYQFTIYRETGESDFERRLAAHGISVDSRPLPPGGPGAFVVIESEGAFAGIIGLESLGELLEPPTVRPDDLNDVSAGYRAVFEAVEETVFAGMTRRQFLAVSREIEDRAYRVGSGTFRAGFQTFSAFEPQVEAYRRLATETDLDVHVYGVADWDPPEIPGVTYHTLGDDPLGLYWVLAFDGGEEGSQACGLLARERPGGYEGFWTDDPDVVDDIAAEFPRV